MGLWHTRSLNFTNCQLQQIKGVLSIGRTHFWQNTFGQHVASLEMHIAPDINEQEVLQSAYQALRGLIKVKGIEQDDGALDAGELTISIIKA
jgi:Co/Zn/Cd efflux system component